MKKRLTKQERNWVLYDVGNSAFMLLVSTIIPIYFNYLAGNAGLSDVEYMACWGYAASIATLFVAIIGPVFGTFSDTKGYKKPHALDFPMHKAFLFCCFSSLCKCPARLVALLSPSVGGIALLNV